MVQVGFVAGMSAHVTRIGRRAHRLVGQPLQEVFFRVGHGRFAQGLRERADLRHIRDRHQPPAGFRDRGAAWRRPEIEPRVRDQRHGRAELADGKVLANHTGPDNTRSVGVKVRKLAVI